MDKLAVGVDIGGTNIKASLVNSRGEIINFKKISTEAKKGFDYTFIKIKGLIKELINSVGLNNICGIGCASAGQIDQVTGKVIFATDNLPGLSGFELKKELENAFKLPIAVENDVNAVAIGEHWKGAAKEFDNFVCLTLGTGVGGAIFKNGEIYHGVNGIAGEIGHMCIKYDGRICNCGNVGCFEQYGSVSALINSFKSSLLVGEYSVVLNELGDNLDNINGEMIFRAMDKRDTLAIKVVNEYIEYLSIGIVNVLHILNPQAIIVGGGISGLGERLMSPLRKKVKERSIPTFFENLVITSSILGDNAGLCGITKNLVLNKNYK